MVDDALQFEWDDEKDAANQRKHKLSFNTAASIFNSPVVEQVDGRDDYGEERRLALGIVEDTVLMVVYTERVAGLYRIISVRKANRHECEFYYRETFAARSE